LPHDTRSVAAVTDALRRLIERGSRAAVPAWVAG
jgi:hypothetical protein